MWLNDGGLCPENGISFVTRIGLPDKRPPLLQSFEPDLLCRDRIREDFFVKLNPAGTFFVGRLSWERTKTFENRTWFGGAKLFRQCLQPSVNGCLQVLDVLIRQQLSAKM